MTAPSALLDQPAGALHLLRIRAFRDVWLAGTLNGLTRWLELLVFGVYVFQETGSPFYVGLVSMLRLLPMALTGPFAGALAEMVGRRRLYLLATAGIAAVTASLSVLALAGALAVWHVALCAFLSGVYWSTDLPVRRTMLGEIAGSARVAPAMGFDAAMNNATRMLGPLIGGALLQAYGLLGVFALGTLTHVVAFVLVWRVAEAGPVAAQVRWVTSSVLEGIGLVRDNPAIVGTLLITVLFNTFAFPVSGMVPVIGETKLALSPALVGLLMSTEGAGAVVGSILVALFGREAYFRTLYWGGLLLCFVGVLVFATAGWVPLAGLALFGFGLGVAGFSAMQTTLIFLAVPADARSRLMGLLSFCVGFAPLGFLHIGWLAQALGPSLGLSIMALEGMLALALVLWRWPEVR